MAIVVAFSQPVPEKLLRKAVRSTQDAADTLGLRARGPSGFGFQITVGPQQPMGAVPINGGGQTFSSFVENESPEDPAKLSEQLQIDQMSIVYRTWRYISWEWQKARIDKLISPALDVILPACSPTMVRMEYLDRFYFNGVPSGARVSELLKTDCPYAAPGVIGKPSLWHTYSGVFTEETPSKKRLQQVHIDVLDHPTASALTPTRWVNCLTALEDRFEASFFDDPELGERFALPIYDDMHGKLKVLLDSIIQPAMSERIYLLKA